MIQFTQQEIERFRERLKTNADILTWLQEQVKIVVESPLKIPDKGIANWSLYYYCSDCSVELTYNFNKPHEHICPICHKVHTGEPFDGAWWRYTHELNYNAAYYLGLLFICTGDITYAQKSKEILMTYAKYYPSYEVHGDIPYNGPGKANAQTLCEAIFIRMLAYAYDLISDTLTVQEQNTIKKDLLQSGADFLCLHRTNQLHNHEVIINAAIGVVGLITEDQNLLNFAIYQDYGLLYQLEKGMLSDGIWFECSLCYHFYALQNFYGFERFAVHTPHSHIKHPNYEKMLHAVLRFLKADFTFPMLNDTIEYHTKLNAYNLYEFSYKMFGGEDLLAVMHKVYESEPRNNIESFFYGVDELPLSTQIVLDDYHDENGSGVTVIRGNHDQYLLFRHGPYAGEHDHYDRLSLSYFHSGENVAADFGTTGYGAFYHYEYFKNTGTHNTVVIDEENQAPSAGCVTAFEKTTDHTFVDAQVQWQKDYKMPDSFTICQWNTEAYDNVFMRRRIYKTEDYLIDIFGVEQVKNKTIDWVMHFGGVRKQTAMPLESIEKLSTKKPFKYLHDAKRFSGKNQCVKTTYVGKNIATDIYTLLINSSLIYAKGPGNPTSTEEEFMLQRSKGENALFINVICCHSFESKDIQQVDISAQNNKIKICVEKKSGNKIHIFDL